MAKKDDNPAAALVRKRWAKTTPEERSEYARKIAAARWGDTTKKQRLKATEPARKARAANREK